MPVTNIPAMTPLSSAYTHADLVSTLREMLNSPVAVNADTQVLRRMVNLGISHTAELLSSLELPYYGVRWLATVEATLMDSMRWISLGTPVAVSAPTASTEERRPPSSANIAANSVTPGHVLYSISRLSGHPSGAQAGIPFVLSQPFPRRTLAEVSALAQQLNTSYRQSIVWAQHGMSLYLAYGSEVDATGIAAEPLYYNAPLEYTIWGFRRPMLDNLATGEQATGGTYNALIDVPDEYVQLTLLYAQKMFFETMQTQVVPAVDQLIAQIVEPLKQREAYRLQQDTTEKERNVGGIRSR